MGRRQEDEHSASNGVVDYDQIDVELDDDGPADDDSDQMHHGREDRHSEGDHGDEDGDNEVSINLEDAIATAEEINKQNSLDKLQHYNDRHNVDGDNESEGSDVADQHRYVDANGELVSAEEIAGIVTDGHNEKDDFD